jgi:hypothetical protein
MYTATGCRPHAYRSAELPRKTGPPISGSLAVTAKDQRDLVKFDRLARRLAPLERKRACTYGDLMRSTRIMESMAAVRDGASPAVRKILASKYGWKS